MYKTLHKILVGGSPPPPRKFDKKNLESGRMVSLVSDGWWTITELHQQGHFFTFSGPPSSPQNCAKSYVLNISQERRVPHLYYVQMYALSWRGCEKPQPDAFSLNWRLIKLSSVLYRMPYRDKPVQENCIIETRLSFVGLASVRYAHGTSRNFENCGLETSGQHYCPKFTKRI